MKKSLPFVLLSFCLVFIFILTPTAFADDVDINETNFPDSVFRNYVSVNCDRDGNGKLSETEISRSRSISLNKSGLSSLKGIEFFTSLTNLSCGNNQLTRLDVSNNTALTSLYCYGNQLTRLDVSNNTALTALYCTRNQLTRLDVSNNTALISLYCPNNQLTRLDVRNNTALTSLDCSSNQLTNLDVGNNTVLTSLDCFGNQLTSLDVSNNTALTALNCSSNPLTSLNVSNNTALTSLNCYNNQLTSLDVSNNTVLNSLDCMENQLTSLDVSNNTALTSLVCDYNQLTVLNINNNSALTSLSCVENQLTSLDVSFCTFLRRLYCFSNNIETLDISNCPKLFALVHNTQPEISGSIVRYKEPGTIITSSTTIIEFDKGVTLITPTPDIFLPASLKILSEDAFSGGAFRYVKLSEQTEYVGPFAFANCPNLRYIYIPNETTTIDSNAFGDIQELVIFGKAGSTADDFAYDHDFTFIPIS